ncbi:MAG TPA: flagellar hook-associated protein FlgL [Gemmatimonadaceae bacterium]|jgi:flagellar hook-associated protein 3 FlgL
MRITNNTITAASLSSLQTNMAAMLKVQQQISTTNRLTAASDDPTAATQIMSATGSLRAIDQYSTNISAANSRVSSEDTALSQITDLLSRAKELAVAQAGSTATADTRTTANAEIQQIFQQIVSIGNTKVGDEYIFGGQTSTTAPFSASGSGATLDYTSTDPQGQRTLAIGAGQTIDAGHDGTQVLLTSGVLDAVKSLSQALDPSSSSYGTAGITSAMSSIDTAFGNVQTLVGEVGGTANRLTVTQANLDAYKTNVTTLKSDLSDTDMTAAITEMTNRQNAYQGALLATSKLTSLTLTDYLR